ncbi:hypothetical protein [Synechococcus sp. CC9605]|uniref:hypothetical protein n=1 Tax=Synechococcus sp. (strain CC9605) TaxID=110662 RepID=UPI00005D5BB7|nr:hypothetical protein [Synechococcus sp. CC9605]ABB35426.1 hypothetical protein Syncc9605_1677 [Synechococcus sp. CC9605]
MTDTNTETTPKKRIPNWVISGGTLLLVFGALQVPKVWRAVNAGIEGGEHICQMAYDGHSFKSAVKSMEGDKRFNYPKQYEGIARQVLFSELKTCPPLKSQIEAQS